MSTFTIFSALEKLSNIDNNYQNNQDNRRLVIPDYFLKLLLQNKTKLLKQKFNKKSVKELLRNRQNLNNYFAEPKLTNFYLAKQKYKSLEKKNYNSENTNSNLPIISERKTLLNLRYKEDPRNY